MARKRTGPDAACYYGGKLMGRCTPADAQGYEQLMKSCGGSAARVLQEYAYFSPELRGILEKVAAVQEKASRSAGIFTNPKTSPWGDVQTCDLLCPGVFLVSTANHGGTMVARDMAAMLSSAACKCGFRQGDFLCFEEDCQENVVLRELLDKKLWRAPDRIRDKAAFEENINQSLREYNPDYWRSRQQGLEREASRPAPARSAER
ncbi:MAG: hypothetical protein RRY97_06665 [Oscillibacter sp.]